jgi:type I restriction enzyme M protein
MKPRKVYDTRGKRTRLAPQLREQQAEAMKFDAAIAANLEELGYGG